MDWTAIYIGALVIGMLALFGDVVALGALCFLAYQAVQWLQSGKWPSYALGVELGLPVDFQPTHWVIIDRLIRFVLFDVEAALVLAAAAGLAHPIKEWLERNTEPSHGPGGSPGSGAGSPGAPTKPGP